MTTRSYEGDALDGTVQWIGERPELDEEAEDVVYASEPEPAGEERATNVPVPDGGERPDREGQTTLTEFSKGEI